MADKVTKIQQECNNIRASHPEYKSYSDDEIICIFHLNGNDKFNINQDDFNVFNPGNSLANLNPSDLTIAPQGQIPDSVFNPSGKTNNGELLGFHVQKHTTQKTPQVQPHKIQYQPRIQQHPQKPQVLQPQKPQQAQTQQQNPQQMVRTALQNKANDLQDKLNKEKAQQGFIGKSWDWIKNTTHLGAGSNKVQQDLDAAKKQLVELDKHPDKLKDIYKGLTGKDLNTQEVQRLAKEKGKVSLKADEKFNKYKEGQKTAVDVTGDIVAGVVSVGIYSAAVAASPFTGGASIAIGIAAATVAGAAIKTGIKYADAKSGGRKYDSIKHDLVTGALDGGLAPITAGIGGVAGKTVATRIGVQAVKEGVETVAEQGAKEGITAVASQGGKQGLTHMMLNPAGNKYVGGTVLKRATAIGAEMLADGTTNGAMYGGIDAASEGKSSEEIAESTAEGALGGAVGGAALGGGFKLLGKLGHNLGKKLKGEKTEIAENATHAADNSAPRIGQTINKTAILSYGDFTAKLNTSGYTMQEVLERAVKQENFIGSGIEGSVYKIPVPKMEDYLIKVPKKHSGKVKGELVTIEDPLPEINVGQSVAKIGEITVIKKVPGETYLPSLGTYLRQSPKQIITQYKHATVLAAEMPQEGYDNLAKLLLELDQKGIRIDNAPGNLLIEKNKSFNPIDLHYNTNNEHSGHNVADTLQILLRDYHNFTEHLTPKMAESLHTIVMKTFTAAKKEGLAAMSEANCTQLNKQYGTILGIDFQELNKQLTKEMKLTENATHAADTAAPDINEPASNVDHPQPSNVETNSEKPTQEIKTLPPNKSEIPTKSSETQKTTNNPPGQTNVESHFETLIQQKYLEYTQGLSEVGKKHFDMLLGYEYSGLIKNGDPELLESRMQSYLRSAKYKANNIEERLTKTLSSEQQTIPHRDFGYSPKDFERIYDFQGDNTYSRELRSGKALDAKTSEAVAHLDRIIQESKPLENDAVVFRTITDTYGVADKKVGDILQDKAYLSTSKTFDGIQRIWRSPSSEGDSYTIKIHLPKGTKGIDCAGYTKKLLGKIRRPYYSGEFILPRNSRLQIVSIDKDLNIIDAKLLPAEEPPFNVNLGHKTKISAVENVEDTQTTPTHVTPLKASPAVNTETPTNKIPDKFNSTVKDGIIGKIAVIDKKTGKPIEIKIERLSKDNVEEYTAYSETNPSVGGYIRFEAYEKAHDGFSDISKYTDYNTKPGEYPGRIKILWMDSNIEGLGKKLRQLAVERSFQLGYEGRVELEPNPGSHIAHYKSGFRTQSVLYQPKNKGILDKLEQTMQDKISSAEKAGVRIPDKNNSQIMFLPQDQIDLWREQIAESPILMSKDTFTEVLHPKAKSVTPTIQSEPQSLSKVSKSVRTTDLGLSSEEIKALPDIKNKEELTSYLDNLLILPNEAADKIMGTNVPMELIRYRTKIVSDLTAFKDANGEKLFSDFDDENIITDIAASVNNAKEAEVKINLLKQLLALKDKGGNYKYTAENHSGLYWVYSANTTEQANAKLKVLHGLSNIEGFSTSKIIEKTNTSEDAQAKLSLVKHLLELKTEEGKPVLDKYTISDIAATTTSDEHSNTLITLIEQIPLIKNKRGNLRYDSIDKYVMIPFADNKYKAQGLLKLAQTQNAYGDFEFDNDSIKLILSHIKTKQDLDILNNGVNKNLSVSEIIKNIKDGETETTNNSQIDKFKTLLGSDAEKISLAAYNFFNSHPEKADEIIAIFESNKSRKRLPNELMLETLNTFEENRFLSNNYLSDLRKVISNEPIIKDFAASTPLSEIAKQVPNGEVTQIGDKLYVNNHGTLEALQISKETYIKLFPFMERFATKQGDLGDCWLISAIENAMDKPSGRVKLYKMFIQNGNDISVKLPDGKQVHFPNGAIIKSANNKNLQGALGFQMLEEAASVYRYSDNAISSVNIRDIANIDAQLDKLDLGLESQAMKEYLGIIGNEQMYNGIDSLNAIKQILEEHGNNSKTLLHFGLAKTNPTFEQKYNLLSGHAYSIKSYDKEKQIVYITNPHNTALITAVPLYEFSKYLISLSIGKL